jgi:hypothetical protein
MPVSTGHVAPTYNLQLAGGEQALVASFQSDLKDSRLW